MTARIESANAYTIFYSHPVLSNETQQRVAKKLMELRNLPEEQLQKMALKFDGHIFTQTDEKSYEAEREKNGDLFVIRNFDEEIVVREWWTNKMRAGRDGISVNKKQILFANFYDPILTQGQLDALATAICNLVIPEEALSHEELIPEMLAVDTILTPFRLEEIQKKMESILKECTEEELEQIAYKLEGDNFSQIKRNETNPDENGIFIFKKINDGLLLQSQISNQLGCEDGIIISNDKMTLVPSHKIIKNGHPKTSPFNEHQIRAFYEIIRTTSKEPYAVLDETLRQKVELKLRQIRVLASEDKLLRRKLKLTDDVIFVMRKTTTGISVRSAMSSNGRRDGIFADANSLSIRPGYLDYKDEPKRLTQKQIETLATSILALKIENLI